MVHSITFFGGPKDGAAEKFYNEPPKDYIQPLGHDGRILTSTEIYDDAPIMRSKTTYRLRRIPSGGWRYFYVDYKWPKEK